MDDFPSFRPATQEHVAHFERLERDYYASNPRIVSETLPGPTLREVWMDGKLFTFVNRSAERFLVYIENDQRRPCYTVMNDRGEVFDMEAFKQSEHADPIFAECVMQEIMRQSVERAAYDDDRLAEDP